MPMGPGLKMLDGMIPILHSPTLRMPGQFGPSRRDLEIFTTLTARISSSIGMPSVMQTMKSTPASTASKMPSAAPRAGTKMHVAFAPSASRRL